jgi:protoporphyrinogen oxidase
MRTAGKIAVIGAGPAGMTAAYQLAKGGARVEVFESSPHIGGLARTLTLWEQRVDIGPHRFFSSDARVNSLWLEVVGDDYKMVNRLTRIYYKNKFFDYPLRALNALSGLGWSEALKCITSYFREKILPTTIHEGSFEHWVVSRFGRRLYEIFFKSYSEKLWGIPCTELDADFAAQRIRKLTIMGAIISALFPKKNTHRTPLDCFAYPLQGTGMVYERMAEYITRKCGVVNLRSPVSKLNTSGGAVVSIQLENGSTVEAEHVISSMPLTLLVRALGITERRVLEACSELRFRNTTLVYLLCDSDCLFPDQWLYIHSPDLAVGRITNFRNWVPQLYGKSPHTVLCMEYWSQEDGIWQAAEDQIISLAKKEIKATGLLAGARVLDGKVIRVARCYPIYRRGYAKHVATIAACLNQFKNLQVIGRYGAFKYNNQDHSILMGMLAAENILKGTAHDLWAVNSDYENYQESAIITSTGLQKVIP